jgi:hypothetical protein
MALLWTSSCTRTRAIGCHIFPEGEAACELARDGSIRVTGTPQAGAIAVEGRGLYFVNRSGKTAPAFPFDNGPDYFVEGLARTVKDGKVGFVDADLNVVIAPVWDFASPFEHGVAAVCTGCVQVAEGEHHRYRGGKWGSIDRRGKIVSPPK